MKVRLKGQSRTGDIYSLGKDPLLMFMGRVYDGNEGDHSTEHPILKTNVVLETTPTGPQRWTIANWAANDLVTQTVRKKPEERCQNGAAGLLARSTSQSTASRVTGVCSILTFLNGVCSVHLAPISVTAKSPISARRTEKPKATFDQMAVRRLQSFVKGQLGFGWDAPGPIPIYLVCDVCGNIQYFRLDFTSDKSGQKWNPLSPLSVDNC